MNTKEVEMLVQLRQYAIEEFERIEGKGNPMAMMRAMDAAYALSSIVKSLDDLLKNHVQIG